MLAFQCLTIIQQDQTLLWTCVGGAHLQFVNNHYATFEYKGMISVWITDYTQIKQCMRSKGGVDIIMSKFNTSNNIIKCTQNIWWAIITYKIWIWRNENCWTNRLHKPDTLTDFEWIKYLNPSDLKTRKYLSNVHKIEGTGFECMNNHYLKFEY